MASQQTNGHNTIGTNGASRYVPRGASRIGIHDFVPELGYREYWYPAVEDKRIGRRPVALGLLGDQVVFFRDTENKVVALTDVCPHRGAFLSGGTGNAPGNFEFKGYITCPYHGYTFDGRGQCVAALTDGPDSKLQPKIQARHYPTRTHEGVVYIWMGETEPVPLEDDLPEEFFDPEVSIQTYVKIWPMNWSLTMENSRDSHNSKIHRGGIRRLINGEIFNKLPAFWEGTNITEEGDNYICITPRVRRDTYRGYFPELGKKWPQHDWWRFKGQSRTDPLREQKRAFNNTRPGGLYRLPSIACPSSRRRNQHLRYFTPIDANNTRMFSFTMRRTGTNPLKRLMWKAYYHAWYVYFGAPQNTNEREDLPIQAFGAMDPRQSQKLGATDAAIIFWRRRMPWKSRDAQRLWGASKAAAAEELIELQEAREAVEAPLE